MQSTPLPTPTETPPSSPPSSPPSLPPSIPPSFYSPPVPWSPSLEPGTSWPSVSTKYPSSDLSGDINKDQAAMKDMEDVWMNVPMPSPFEVRQRDYLRTKTKKPSEGPA